MKNSGSLQWVIKNGKKQIPKIIILSLSNIVLALVSTALALVSKKVMDAAQGAANAKTHDMFVQQRNTIIIFGIITLIIITGRLWAVLYSAPMLQKSSIS